MSSMSLFYVGMMRWEPRWEYEQVNVFTDFYSICQRVRRRDFLEFSSSKSHQISWPRPFPLVEHEDVCRRWRYTPENNTIFNRRYISKRLFFHYHVSFRGCFYGVNGFRPAKYNWNMLRTFGSGDSLGKTWSFHLGVSQRGVVAKIIVPLCVGPCSRVVFVLKHIRLDDCSSWDVVIHWPKWNSLTMAHLHLEP